MTPEEQQRMELLEVWVGRAHERLRKSAQRLKEAAGKDDGVSKAWLANMAAECSDAAKACSDALNNSVKLTNWKAIALRHVATIERLQTQLDKFYKPR